MKPERAMARAHRWKGLLEEGRYRSAGELAEADPIDRSFVSRLLRLTPLALRVAEAIPMACRGRGVVPKGVDRDKNK
jgi:hypothetical protein